MKKSLENSENIFNHNIKWYEFLSKQNFNSADGGRPTADRKEKPHFEIYSNFNFRPPLAVHRLP